MVRWVQKKGTEKRVREMTNEILLRRKNHIYLEKEPETGTENQSVRVLTMMKNMENLGYTFSKELYEFLCIMERGALDEFYLELAALLKERVGAEHVWNPMYPNFPQEVMEKSQAELYGNAIMHYWSEGQLFPSGRKRERLPLFDETKVTVLTLGTKEELMEIFRNLASANGSLSEQDLQDIRWCFSNMPEVAHWLPEMIPNRENAAYIGACFLESCPLLETSVLRPYIRTAADVLRLVAALSDGDVSLKKKVHFKSFRRRERRILMELLAESSGLLEEMHRRPEVWKRLGERLHPGEFHGAQYERVRNAFEKLRNGQTMETFSGKAERALLKKNVPAALAVLKDRPGELARRLDMVLRIEPEDTPEENSRWWETRIRKIKVQQEILETFEAVSTQVSTPVLLQVRMHFLYRNHQAFRCYFPKGKLAEARMIPNVEAYVEEDICRQVVSICEKALTERFSGLPSMGKVYLSEKLKNYMVPFNQRAASRAARTLVRGSRLCLNEKAGAVRGFIWWTNTAEGRRVDIDLSAVIFDEHWNYLEHVSYTNLRSHKYQSCHSGDIVDGGPADGDGACEFLDVDLDSVVKYGGRYVGYQVYSYTRQPFSELPHVSFGYMERQEVKSGEIFEPCLVRQRMGLTSGTTVAVPMILDCVTRQMIWCDAGLGFGTCRRNAGGNNLESNLSGVALACYAIVNMHRTNLYDLMRLHIDGRGELCGTKEEADMVFDVEEGITPFDTDVILAEYLC